MTGTKKFRDGLLAAVLILFVMQALLLPLVVGTTYASKGRTPEHIITYSGHRLRWDAQTVLDENGAAQLDFFDSQYQNVRAHNDDQLVVPGVENRCLIRLQNSANGPIGYTAVLYEVRKDILPVVASMTGENFEDTERFSLPESLKDVRVIRAVQGSLPANQMQEFDIDWLWAFEDSEYTSLQDAMDTYLGDQAAAGRAEEMTLGFYLIVTDNNTEVYPDSPKTGDASQLGLYLLLMLVSGSTLVILLVERVKDAKKNS